VTITSPTATLLVEHAGPLVQVTINRPEAMNSFDDDLHAAFPALLDRIEDDPEVRAVVLTGAGRAFSAGGNTADFPLFADDQRARGKAMRQGKRLVDAMLGFRVPVVAAVNGPAVGLGCTLATLCDVVFVADDTFLADPHVTVGLVAGDGSAVTWPFLTSMLRAKEYLLTGDRIPAARAVELGLANHAVPRAELLERASAFAAKVAGLPPQAVQDTKSVLNQHLRSASVATLGFGLAAETHSHDTPEYGVIADRLSDGASGR
jgi:enoyl-CoA hydratase